MNYQRIYSSLIAKAKERGSCEGYFEVHHVTPKCMGGDDQPDNLVKLTPEEHYLAHQLLAKVHPNNQKLLHAAMCMANFRSSNKLYGWLRRRWAKQQSLKMSGEENPSKGTRVIHNPDLRKTSRIPKGEDLPEGWLEGGVYDWDKKPKRSAKQKRREELTPWFNLYIEQGWQAVKDSGYPFSKQNLVQRLARNFPEFKPQNGKRRGFTTKPNG